jgi:hypothetical protein
MDIDQLFYQVVNTLKQRKVLFAVAGGIAVSLYRKEKRTTMDLDFLLLADDSLECAKEIILEFGLKPAIARQADLAGGPMVAIKKKSTPPYIVVGRNPEDPESFGIDFLLPNIPWFHQALNRAQDNQIDFGQSTVPVLTIEDIILAKLSALKDKPRQFKHLDDLQSIFSKTQEINLIYLRAQMTQLQLVFAKNLFPNIPKILQKI